MEELTIDSREPSLLNAINGSVNSSRPQESSTLIAQLLASINSDELLRVLREIVDSRPRSNQENPQEVHSGPSPTPAVADPQAVSQPEISTTQPGDSTAAINPETFRQHESASGTVKESLFDIRSVPVFGPGSSYQNVSFFT